MDVIDYSRDTAGAWIDTRLEQSDDRITVRHPLVALRVADLYKGTSHPDARSDRT